MSTRSPARKCLRARRNASSGVGRRVTSARSVTGGDMRRVRVLALSTIVIALARAPAAPADRVLTVKGASAPGPAKYDRVRVIEQGPRHARNVLVLVPGTSGGAAYFHPVAADIVKRLKGWRVWSVDRRENLLEDHSVLDRALARQITPRDLFRYYLEWLSDPSITPHFT